ncbi:MAG TPA: thioredoxin-dependent thiol peroxidase, partial [Longimicrobiales bacterium]|nr:thioredoxin-dependent thiol peroxidase [Longimicrobiales bacterium]
IDVGDVAPDFSLPSDTDGTVRLADYRGRTVVLYFYPKDLTSGCTVQACDLRDGLDRIEERNAAVLGVSPDPVEMHAQFRAKHDLNFPLLADEDHEVAEAYGVWKEKSMYGRKYMGIERSTFIIGPDGVVTHAWRAVPAKGHADLVLDAI